MRRWVAPLLIVAAFVAVRVVLSGPVATQHLEQQTGVVLPVWYEEVPWLAAGLWGDGLVYVTQTVDPWGTEGYSDRLGTPVYRFHRIGYPMAGWLLSAGQSDLAPIGLFSISTLSIAVAARIAATQVSRLGPRAWLLVGNPAVLIGYLSATSEPFGVALAALALTATGWWAIPMSAVRPSLVTVLADRPLLLAKGALTIVGIRAIGLTLFDGPADNGIHNFALPLTDYWNVQHPASWALALFAVGCVVVGVRQRSPAWLLSGLLVLCFSEPVLEDPANAWRASGMLWLLVSVGPWPRRGRQHSAHSDGQVALGARLPNRPRGFRSL